MSAQIIDCLNFMFFPFCGRARRLENSFLGNFDFLYCGLRTMQKGQGQKKCLKSHHGTIPSSAIFKIDGTLFIAYRYLKC